MRASRRATSTTVGRARDPPGRTEGAFMPRSPR
jgi:hypothetical protein